MRAKALIGPYQRRLIIDQIFRRRQILNYTNEYQVDYNAALDHVFAGISQVGVKVGKYLFEPFKAVGGSAKATLYLASFLTPS